MAKRSSSSLARRVDRATRGVRGVPQFGRLEENVDAILRSRGLELNQPPQKLLDRTKRGGLFAADGGHHLKGEKTIRANVRKMKAGTLRPTRGKRLRRKK